MAKQSKMLEERHRKKMLRIYIVVGAVAAAGAVLGAQTVLTQPPAGGSGVVCPVTTGNRCAVIHVGGGDIVFEIHEKEVPVTASHFIQLMQTGYYNGLKWHRVEDWVIQTGQGSDVPTIQHEWSPALHNDRAMVGVARTSDPNSGNSQFYILRSDARYLDYQVASNPGYTVFGTVRHGMSLVDGVQLNDPIVELTVVAEYKAA